MSPEPPTAAAKYVEQNLSFPTENEPPIQANEAGIYILTVGLTLDDWKPYEINKKTLVE